MENNLSFAQFDKILMNEKNFKSAVTIDNMNLGQTWSNSFKMKRSLCMNSVLIIVSLCFFCCEAVAWPGGNHSGKVVRTFKKTAFFNIKEYGAKGDGKRVDTKAIDSIIDVAARQGGGTVYFPAGTYLSYTIHLKSNICLYLEQGAVLLAADSAAGGQYDAAEPNAFDQYQDYGHSHWHNSLIFGENLENISIIGPGIINGQGLSRNATARHPWGNKAIGLKLCRNVILKDFTILTGGHFGILATGVDNLTIGNLKMDTNRDGMDIDCCQNVRVSDCSINSPYDDGICLKSSYALGVARATQNVTITNCEVSGFDLGTFFNGTFQRKEWNKVPDHEGPTGRIKFGTESNGGFINITISNCVFEYCRGLALETVDGALLEDISITNITMRDVTNSPIFLRLGARMRGPSGVPPGKLRRVMVSNVSAYNADAHFACIVAGLPGYDIEDVKLSNIHIWYRPIDSAVSRVQTKVPEYAQSYPEPAKMGVMPSYGFFIRHASGIELNDVQIRYLGTETRPAFYLEDVKNITLRNVQAQPVEGSSLIVLKHVSNFNTKDCNGIKDRNIKTAADARF